MSSVSPPTAHGSTDAPHGGFLQSGEVVLGGRFRMEAVLGGGGMGTVYRAEQLSLGRTVAIKVLRQDLRGLPDVAERFRREARLLSTVDHPSVVRVIDFGEHDASPCLVLEYVEGPTLHELLVRDVPLPVDRTVRLLRQLAVGLQAIHRQGIIHRDLKPDNVLVARPGTPDEQAKLADFGIARLMRPEPTQPSITQLGFVMGTPEFVSPEQAMSQPIDERTDLYSLGLIAFRMLTGKPAFWSDIPSELVAMQIHQPPPRMIDVHPPLASVPCLVELVESCLSKRKDQRPGSAEAFLAALEPRPVSAGVPGTGQDSEVTAPVPRRRRGGVAAGMALVVVGAVASGWWWSTRPGTVARELLEQREPGPALEVLEQAAAEGDAALTQLRAVALYQVGRAEEGRQLLEALDVPLKVEALVVEALAEDFGRTEGRKEAARTRRLLVAWPRAGVLPHLKRLAASPDSPARWGALRLVDLEWAGQGLPLAELYVESLGSKECSRRSVSARRLGELRASSAVPVLQKLAREPKRKGGLFNLGEDDCGQAAAAQALRRIAAD